MIKKCRFCAEDIQEEAVKCKHCGEFLNKDNGSDKLAAPRTHRRGTVECPYCHQIITPKAKGITVESLIVTVVLLFLFIIPGIIYMVWESNKKQCPNCKMIL